MDIIPSEIASLTLPFGISQLHTVITLGGQFFLTTFQHVAVSAHALGVVFALRVWTGSNVLACDFISLSPPIIHFLVIYSFIHLCNLHHLLRRLLAIFEIIPCNDISILLKVKARLAGISFDLKNIVILKLFVLFG